MHINPFQIKIKSNLEYDRYFIMWFGAPSSMPSGAMNARSEGGACVNEFHEHFTSRESGQFGRAASIYRRTHAARSWVHKGDMPRASSMRRLRAFVAFAATLGLLWHSSAAATTTTPRDGVRRLLRQAAASYYYASEATVGRQLMQVETVTIPLGGRGQVPWGDMFTFDTPPVAPGAEGALPSPDALMHAAESFLSEPTTNALGNGGALMDEACSPIVRKAMNAAPESAFFPKAAKDVYNNFCDPVASAEAPAEGDALADQLEKLAQLRDRGVLSLDEFEKAKKKLING